MKLSTRIGTAILGMASLVAFGVPSYLSISGMATAQTNLQSQQVQNSPGFQKAYSMSEAFRTVSREVMPAVVAIRTEGKTVERMVSSGTAFPADPMLREFFGNDPRFEQFFGPRLSPRNGLREKREFKLPSGQGSGFLIAPEGVVLTNAHVVDDAERVIVMLADGREFEATDIRMDERADVAVLKIDANESLPYLPLGDDENTEIGDWVLAFGSPFGMHRTVTQGIVSAKGRGLSGDSNKEFLQTDAAVNPGNSGGPLVNLRGEVVGMNTAISTRSGGYDGVSLAVPVNLVRWASDQLLETGEVERAYVGIQMQEINAELAKAFNLSVPRGVVVTGVMPDSPADKAGFQPGDVIIKVNGKTVRGQLNMLGLVERLTVGKSYPIEVQRNGKRLTLDIAVVRRPENFASLEGGPAAEGSSSDAANSATIPMLDVEVQDLTDSIAAELQLNDTSGVVITSVKKGGAGDRAGLRPGMVIASIANRDVSDVSELNRMLDDLKQKSRLLLLVKVADRNTIMSRFISVPIAN